MPGRGVCHPPCDSCMLPASGCSWTTPARHWKWRMGRPARCASVNCSSPCLVSNYTYAEATFTQRLVDWIGSHVRAFAFFGGVTAQVVSDNLRSGITKACFYEPAVNRTYAEMAAHYDTAVVPARPRKPRD